MRGSDYGLEESLWPSKGRSTFPQSIRILQWVLRPRDLWSWGDCKMQPCSHWFPLVVMLRILVFHKQQVHKWTDPCSEREQISERVKNIVLHRNQSAECIKWRITGFLLHWGNSRGIKLNSIEPQTSYAGDNKRKIVY